MFTKKHLEAGLTTAEYAAGTVGVCGLGGVIAVLLKSEWFQDMMQSFIETIPTLITSFM